MERWWDDLNLLKNLNLIILAGSLAFKPKGR
jgi:hypothetical protein